MMKSVAPRFLGPAIPGGDGDRVAGRMGADPGTASVGSPQLQLAAAGNSGSDGKQRQLPPGEVFMVASGSFREERVVDATADGKGVTNRLAANLAEGHGRFGRDRAHRWRIACASANEVDVHLRILCTCGAVPRGKTDATLQLFDEVRAMTWKLINP
jgi:hypothetical protein